MSASTLLTGEALKTREQVPGAIQVTKPALGGGAYAAAEIPRQTVTFGDSRLADSMDTVRSNIEAFNAPPVETAGPNDAALQILMDAQMQTTAQLEVIGAAF